MGIEMVAPRGLREARGSHYWRPLELCHGTDLRTDHTVTTTKTTHAVCLPCDPPQRRTLRMAAAWASSYETCNPRGHVHVTTSGSPCPDPQTWYIYTLPPGTPDRPNPRARALGARFTPCPPLETLIGSRMLKQCSTTNPNEWRRSTERPSPASGAVPQARRPKEDRLVILGRSRENARIQRWTLWLSQGRAPPAPRHASSTSAECHTTDRTRTASLCKAAVQAWKSAAMLKPRAPRTEDEALRLATKDSDDILTDYSGHTQATANSFGTQQAEIMPRSFCTGHVTNEWPSHLAWDNILVDSERGAWVYVVRAWPYVTTNDTDMLLRHTRWQKSRNRTGTILRHTAWLVAGSCRCPYCYGNETVPPRSIPKWLEAIMARWLQGICPKGLPNSVNLNLYETGAQAIGWHADDEELFGGRHHDCTIISVTLGGARQFLLKLKSGKHKTHERRRCFQASLGHGDLCVMGGRCQQHYLHKVPRHIGHAEPRINATFRWITNHAPACPLSAGSACTDHIIYDG